MAHGGYETPLITLSPQMTTKIMTTATTTTSSSTAAASGSSNSTSTRCGLKPAVIATAAGAASPRTLLTRYFHHMSRLHHQQQQQTSTTTTTKLLVAADEAAENTLLTQSPSSQSQSSSQSLSATAASALTTSSYGSMHSTTCQQKTTIPLLIQQLHSSSSNSHNQSCLPNNNNNNNNSSDSGSMTRHFLHNRHRFASENNNNASSGTNSGGGGGEHQYYFNSSNHVLPEEGQSATTSSSNSQNFAENAGGINGICDNIGPNSSVVNNRISDAMIMGGGGGGGATTANSNSVASLSRQSSQQQQQQQQQADDSGLLEFTREAMRNLPPMQYRYLGRTGVPVSVLALQIGQWIGNSGEIILPERNIEKILHAAYHAGINVFDVSTGRGSLLRAELLLETLLERLKWRRSSYVICCQVQANGNSALESAVNRKSIIESCCNSLQRLHFAEYIDILYVPSPRHPLTTSSSTTNDPTNNRGGGAPHIPQAAVYNYFSTIASIEEIVRACTHLICTGRIMHWACHDDWTKREVLEAFTVARQCQLVAPAILRCRYDFFHRESVEVGLSEVQLQIGLGVVVLSQLNSSTTTATAGTAAAPQPHALSAQAVSPCRKTLEQQPPSSPSPRSATTNVDNSTGKTFTFNEQQQQQQLALTTKPGGVSPVLLAAVNAETLLQHQEKLIRAVKMKRLSQYVEAHFPNCQLKQLELAWCLRVPQVHVVLLGVNSIEMLRHAIEALLLVNQLNDARRLLDVENILFNSPLAKLPAAVIQQHNALLYSQTMLSSATGSASGHHANAGNFAAALQQQHQSQLLQQQQQQQTVVEATPTKKKERKKSTSRISLHEGQNPYQSDPSALPVAPVAARARRMSMY